MSAQRGEPRAAAAAFVQPGRMPTLEGCVVLVVDDNPINQQVAAELLESAQARVCLADDGRKALDLMRHCRVDCVLMDVHMPVMDGLEATRELRATPAFAHIPVIALTADSRAENRKRCFEAGMDDFISKPIGPEMLYEKVGRWARANTGPAVEPIVDAPRRTSVRPRRGALVGDPEVIDLSVLAKMLDSSGDKVREIAMIYVNSMAKTMDEIGVALDAGDLATLSALGHRAKSSSATVGAVGFSRLCNALQELDPGGSLEAAREIVSRMVPLRHQIAAHIHKTFEAPPAPAR